MGNKGVNFNLKSIVHETRNAMGTLLAHVALLKIRIEKESIQESQINESLDSLTEATNKIKLSLEALENEVRNFDSGE